MVLRDNNATDDLTESSEEQISGLTKEQLLLINLKDLANEYLEIEKLKKLNYFCILRKEDIRICFSISISIAFITLSGFFSCTVSTASCK